MFKKGQAAMEFLMTYGWAILVVLAAIGALAYFGVLSPDNLLPERTTFQAPLSNLDNAYTDGSTQLIEIPFSNNVGFSINITNGGNVTDLEIAGSSTACSPTITSAKGSAALTSAEKTVKNNENFRIGWDCGASTWTAGGRIKGTFTFQYKNLQTGQTRKTSGSVNGKIS